MDPDISPEGNLLQSPPYAPLPTYALPTTKQYRQQFADLYFLRLAQLKPAAEALAAEAWADFQIADETAFPVPRVLDVRQGSLCWVTGTVYLDMPLKPNILDDISADHWISAPPPRAKYLSPSGEDQIMLEDESGRLRLVGSILLRHELVTGCIVSVMGTENREGEFEVVDLKVPDLAPQPAAPAATTPSTAPAGGRGKVAVVSGLGISGDEVDSLTVDLLMEYLLGEAGGDGDDAAKITRLVIAGNSLAEAAPLPLQATHDETLTSTTKKAAAAKKYGYDSAAYNPAPTAHLDRFLATLLPSLPVTLLPGASDPANVSLPQQGVHGSLFPQSRAYAALPSAQTGGDGGGGGWFDTATNPFEADIGGWRWLGTGGQNIDDVFKYVEGEERLVMMERLLRWRLIAPTAPDTLWCYPFQTEDPFVLKATPHVFFTGNQPRFETSVIAGDYGEEVRLIAVPKFKQTGEVVLVDLETLEVELVRIGVDDGVDDRDEAGGTSLE